MLSLSFCPMFSKPSGIVSFHKVLFLISLVIQIQSLSATPSCDIYVYNNKKELVDCVKYEETTTTEEMKESDGVTTFPTPIEVEVESIKIDASSKDRDDTFQLFQAAFFIVLMLLLLLIHYLRTKHNCCSSVQEPTKKSKFPTVAKPVPPVVPYHIMTMPMPPISDGMLDKNPVRFDTPPPYYSVVHV